MSLRRSLRVQKTILNQALESNSQEYDDRRATQKNSRNCKPVISNKKPAKTNHEKNKKNGDFDSARKLKTHKTTRTKSSKSSRTYYHDDSSLSENIEDSQDEWKPSQSLNSDDDDDDDDESNDKSSDLEEAEMQSDQHSLNHFVTNAPIKPETKQFTKKTAKLLLFSEFKPKSTKNRPNRIKKKQDQTYNLSNISDKDSDDMDDADWEEVNDDNDNDKHNHKSTSELDFLNDLLNPTQGETKQLEVNNDNNDKCNPVVTVAIPTIGSKIKLYKNKDLQSMKLLLIRRQISEYYKQMHLVHVLCYLSYSRFLNRMCDNSFYQALSLSVLCKSNKIYNNKSKKFLQNTKWNIEHLESSLVCLLSRKSLNSIDSNSTDSNVDKENSTVSSRLCNSQCTEKDCITLLVAGLRALEFDVRIVIGLNPIPIKPNPSVEQNLSVKNSSFTTATTISNNDKLKTTNSSKKINRKIISSSSDDSDDKETVFHPHNISKKNHSKPELFVFAEVFLPLLNRWICIDPSTPTGSVDKFSYKEKLLYVIGVCSVSSKSQSSAHYVGRNPVDLAARYDSTWCVHSRSKRLPLEKWTNLLNIQRKFFDKDALYNDVLVPCTEELITVQRDRADESAIRAQLSSEPIPSVLCDLKNHPLYVLQRHLLKFQVIYPPDAIPLGYFRNEPIYSRDCVHLCHTRESWLKEAMVVRPHETPAKIVKARLSLKRKLLKGSSSEPETVEIYGPWQVEPYVPPVAEGGIVPRSPHGTVELFKPCMLPVGCVHICLSGIQNIAKKLGIDCVPAVVGWTFHGAGWAHPKLLGYVVCKEALSILINAWREAKMNTAKAIAEERSQRALENWKRLVRGLFIWHRVKAQFALAPLHASKANVETYEKSKKKVKSTSNKIAAEPMKESLPQVAECTLGSVLTEVESKGWIRLGSSDKTHLLPKFSINEDKPSSKRCNPTRKSRKTTKKRKYKKESTSEESDFEVPSSPDDSSDDFQ